jgi:CYTH domain-containing protein
MSKEIERKYQVLDLSVIEGRLGSRIVQGYIIDQPMTVRVRVIEAEAFLALKSKMQGIERDEYEFPIPMRHAHELLDRYCGTRVIEKTRYRVPYNDVLVEIDVFGGRHVGLVVAEIELSSADQQFELPAWLGIELTYDRRFSNGALAMSDEIPVAGNDPDDSHVLPVK